MPLSLLPRPSFAQVDQIWQCQFQHCMDLTAGSGDTLNATSAGSTAPCKSGTATPATCTVGACFFDTDATAGQNLFLCTASNTWTASSPDLSQYLYLPGRSTTTNDPTISTGSEGTIYGGDSSGDDLRLRANSNSAASGSIFADSQLDLWPNQPDATGGTPPYGLVYQPDFALNGVGASSAGIVVSPTVHMGGAASTGASFAALASLGYVLVDDATAGAGGANIQLFNAAHYVGTSVAQNPPSQNTLNDITTVYNDGTTNRTQTAFTSHLDFTILSTSSSGTMTRTNHYSFRSSPRVVANGSTATTITTRRGVYVEDVGLTGAGAAVTTNIGIEIDPLTSGATDIGLRNEDTTVYTPATQAISSVNDQIDCTATAVALTVSAGGIVLASNPQVLDGQNGQICYIANVDSADTLTTNDGNGINTAAARALGPQDTLTLMYSTTIGDWVELAFSNN